MIASDLSKPDDQSKNNIGSVSMQSTIQPPDWSTNTKSLHGPSGRNEHSSFSFPTDKNFWANLQVAVGYHPGASAEPVYLVESSHSTEALKVNKDFMHDFVSDWESANALTLVLRKPDGTHEKFRASHDFLRAMRDLPHVYTTETASGADAAVTPWFGRVQVKFGGLTHHVNAAQWSEFCREWQSINANSGAFTHPSRRLPINPPPLNESSTSRAVASDPRQMTTAPCRVEDPVWH